MVVDIIAEKRSVTFSWDLIFDTDLRTILNLISASVFHTLEYPDPRGGDQFNITAKMDGEPRISNWRVLEEGRIWQGVTLSFVER